MWINDMSMHTYYAQWSPAYVELPASPVTFNKPKSVRICDWRAVALTIKSIWRPVCIYHFWRESVCLRQGKSATQSGHISVKVESAMVNGAIPS